MGIRFMRRCLSRLQILSAMVYDASLDWLDDRRRTPCPRCCKLPDNSGTCRNLHLDHHQSKERLYRVSTNLHAVCNLFAGETLREELHRFAFSLSQIKLCTDVCERRMAARCIPLQQHSESGLQGIVSASRRLESSCRCNGACRT